MLEAPPLVSLPSRGDVVNASATAEHPKEPKRPRTRDMSYPRAFPVQPPEHTVRVKVPGSMSHKRLTCALFFTSLDAVGTCAARRACLRHPHSPPAFTPRGVAEGFYGCPRRPRDSRAVCPVLRGRRQRRLERAH